MIRGIAGRTYHIIENLMSRVISFLLKPTPSLKSDKWLFFSSLLHLCYHSNGKVELIRDFYTLVIVQINKFVKNNFYIFAHTCRVGGGGAKSPLMLNALLIANTFTISKMCHWVHFPVFY